MKETMIETENTYTLELGRKCYIIEHVPARVYLETKEQFFSPETVEQIQPLIKGGIGSSDPKSPKILLEGLA